MKIYNKHEKKHYALLDKLKALVRENEAWVNINLPLVTFPKVGLYLQDGKTKVAVENDTMLGLRFYPDFWTEEFRIGNVFELSGPSVAKLRDTMLEHWNTPESIAIREARERITALMNGESDPAESEIVKSVLRSIQ